MIRTIAVAGAAIVAGLGIAATPAVATGDKHTTPQVICAAWNMRGATGVYPAVSFGGPPPGSFVGKHTATLVKPTVGEQPGVEFASKALGVKAFPVPREVTVNYAVSADAKTTAGAVRMFGYKAANADTLNDGPDFKDIATANSGVLKFTLPAGATLGTLGLVYDASNDGKGAVTFTNLKVGKALVQFTRCVKPLPPQPCVNYAYLAHPPVKGVVRTLPVRNLCKDFPGYKPRTCDDIKKPVRVIGKDVWHLVKGRGPLACMPQKPTPTPTATLTPTPTPTATQTTTPPTTAPTTPPTTTPSATPTATQTVSPTTTTDAPAVPVPAGNDTSLPKTGPSLGLFFTVGALAVVGGLAVLIVTAVRSRRSKRFEA